MWQQILITLAVVAAAVYVTWTMLGTRLRLRLVDAMTRFGVASEWAARQRAKLSASGCSNCSVAHGAHPRMEEGKSDARRR